MQLLTVVLTCFLMAPKSRARMDALAKKVTGRAPVPVKITRDLDELLAEKLKEKQAEQARAASAGADIAPS